MVYLEFSIILSSNYNTLIHFIITYSYLPTEMIAVALVLYACSPAAFCFNRHNINHW